MNISNRVMIYSEHLHDFPLQDELILPLLELEDESTEPSGAEFLGDGDSVPLTQEQIELALSHLSLVEAIAASIFYRVEKYLDNSLSLEDLVQEGTEALLRQARFYDPDHPKQASFATFASSRVRGSIYDLIRKTHPLPKSDQAMAKKWADVEEKLRQQMQREPTFAEVAQRMSLDPKEAAVVRGNVGDLRPFSFNIILNDDGNDLFLEDTLEDRTCTSTAQLVSKLALTEAVKSKRLSERQRKVILLHHFMGLTLKEVGYQLSVTESRISQLFTKSLKEIARSHPNLSDSDDRKVAA